MSVNTATPIARAALAAAAGLVVLVAAGCTAPTAPRSAAAAGMPTTPAQPLILPAPTGDRPVGATTVHLKDTSRADPWDPEIKARELMVSLWYPATARQGQRAAYMTAKESELFMRESGVTGVPSDFFHKTGTNAVADAEPAGAASSLPLVILSPGFTKPRATLTGLAEELASRGYVVAAIDHVHESYATALPGGRLATCLACDFDSDFGFGSATVKGRAADVSYVLDALIGPHPRWKGSSLIDPAKIAMVGQSIGGASAVAAMVADSRVRAGIDMDGTTYARIPKKGLSRPFMFLGNQDGHTPGGRDPSWDRDWALLTGWKRWIVVEGSSHQSFTDIPLLDASTKPGTIEHGLTSARALQITRHYVVAFLDLHLRGTRQPDLTGPSAAFPEVKHCSVTTKTCQ
jgi:dienelactone hydrolase